MTPRSQTDRRDNGSVNGLSVRLFQQSCSPKVELHHACLPLPLKSRLALVQSNYHLLLVVCSGTPLCPPLLTLFTLFSPAVFSYIVPATFRGLSHFFRPQIGAHYANSQTSRAHCFPSMVEISVSPWSFIMQTPAKLASI